MVAMSLRFRFFFFFSSRRRHTRLVSDWSSDVCSSDLRCGASPGGASSPKKSVSFASAAIVLVMPEPLRVVFIGYCSFVVFVVREIKQEIGRASCRERV